MKDNSLLGKCLDPKFCSTSLWLCSRFPFRQLPGNNISGHYFCHNFLPPPLFFPSPPSSTFLLGGVQNLTGARKNLEVNFPDPILRFVTPIGHFGFCRRCVIVGGLPSVSSAARLVLGAKISFEPIFLWCEAPTKFLAWKLSVRKNCQF